MNQSQRCAKEIYERTNNLIDFSQKNKTLKDTFYDIKMKAVAGKNPISPNAVVLSKFDEYKQEQEYILQEIKTIFRKNEHASIAILVRNNYNIETYASFLTEQGYKIITKNDTLNEQPIFRLMHKILKFYNHPWNNDYVYEIANTLSTQNLIHFTNAELSKIKESKTPFILQNETTLKSKELIQLNWDLNYWLETTVNDIETFIFKIGNYYYHSEIEKSNISLIALLFKNLYSQYKNLELVIEKLDDISNQQKLRKYKY